MVQFTTKIHRFEKQGEKSGWTYIEVPADIAQELIPGNKKSFRVKGKLDKHAIAGVALLPMGGGSFILPINAGMRKGTGKKAGAMLQVKLEVDKKEYELNREFMECLADEPAALEHFNTFTRGVKNYYSKWIESAKTEQTKTKRIAIAITALSRKMHYGEMIRSLKEKGEMM
jgi:hypothetical protein